MCALSVAVGKVQGFIKEMNLPPQYQVKLGGRAKALDETVQNFITAFLLSLLFMYMVLAAQFESFLHPITIMLALPLSIPFAVFSLWLLNNPLDVYSIFGMFMLFGIMKKNGILQVDTTNQLLRSGMPVRAAILEANRLRLRPILMTTLTLVAAMAPMTFAKGPGAASRAALARVVVGGQALSLLITLLIVPVAYSLFDELATRLRARRVAAPRGGLDM